MTKEELRNKFFMDCTDMNDGTPKVDMSPHNVFEWINRNIIEQKLIDQEPKQREVSEDLQYQNLTCLINGFELTSYQKALAKKEFNRLISIKQTNK
jgi:hypothetical protein